MDKYIIQAQKTRHTYMLWVSAFLLIFNVYHTKLMSIFLFSASSGSAFVIQGFAVALMLVYFMTDKKVSLLQGIRTGSKEMVGPTDKAMLACLFKVLLEGIIAMVASFGGLHKNKVKREISLLMRFLF